MRAYYVAESRRIKSNLITLLNVFVLYLNTARLRLYQHYTCIVKRKIYNRYELVDDCCVLPQYLCPHTHIVLPILWLYARTWKKLRAENTYFFTRVFDTPGFCTSITCHNTMFVYYTKPYSGFDFELFGGRAYRLPYRNNGIFIWVTRLIIFRYILILVLIKKKK